MSGSAETIKEFLVGLGFNVDAAGLKTFTGALGTATAQAAAIGAAAVAASGAVFAMVQHVAAEYFELDKLATRFRSTAAAVDAFRDAGTILGLSEEQTIGSMKSLDKAIGDTALGVGRAKKIFEAIGQTVLDVRGKMRPTAVVMSELAEKFKHMERGKALAIMDRLGLDPALLRMFNTDLGTLGAEIEAIEQAAGFDLSTAMAESKAFTEAWRNFNMEVEKSKLLVGKLVDAVAVRLMPRFRATLDRLRAQMVDFRQMVMANMDKIRNVIEGTVNVLLRIVEFVTLAAYRLIQVASFIVSGIITLFGKLDSTTQVVVLGILAIAAAWKFLNLSFLATPLGQVLALAAAIGLLVDDYLIWKEGGDSLIDWSRWEPGITSAMSAITALRDTVGAAFTAIFAAVDLVVSLLSGDFSQAWFAVGQLVESVIAIFTRAWDAIKNVGATLGNVAGGVASFFGGQAMAPALVPSPQAAATLGGGQASVNQTTEIIIQGATNPDATAKSVAAQQNRVNNDLARNTRGAMR